MRSLRYLVFVGASCTAFAAVPHTFTAGEPTSAAEMNENFVALDTTLQKKASQATIDVLATSIGTKASQTDLVALKAKESTDSATLARSIATITPKSIGAIDKASGDSLFLKANPGTFQTATARIHDLRLVQDYYGLATQPSGRTALLSYDNPVVKRTSSTDTGSYTIWHTGNLSASTLPGGPYLPLAGGSMNGNIRLPDGDLYLRAGGNDINHGIGYYGANSTNKLWAGVNVDGPVVYGCSGGALGTLRNGATPQTIALRWSENGNVTIIGKLVTQAAASFSDVHIAGSLVTNPGATPADYVFEPDYKLASLSDIAAYTAEHKHLPEVPSGAEMTTEGVDLAKMNMILLKKVEELTLHAIAQQKEIDAQKAAFEALTRRLEAAGR